MPVIDDNIKTSWVSELDGVAMSNEITWKIVDLGDDPTNLSMLIAITTAYGIAWSPPLTMTTTISCAVYENLSSPEAKEINFPIGIEGLIIGTPHPQDQVIRFSEYTVEQPNGTLKKGAYNLSGMAQSLSTNGIVNDVALFSPLRQFLSDQLVLGTGWTIKPVQRFQSTRGKHDGPADPTDMIDSFQGFTPGELVGRIIFNDKDKSQAVITANTNDSVVGTLTGGEVNIWNPGDSYHITPANFAFDDLVEVVCNTTFRKLASRTTKLCQVA